MDRDKEKIKKLFKIFLAGLFAGLIWYWGSGSIEESFVIFYIVGMLRFLIEIN